MPTTQETFETIYRKKLWGGRKRFWQRFYSGSGSSNKAIVGPYVAAVLPIIAGKRVVDLGCGDFTVGKQLYKAASHYIGCDIARPLIEHNKKKFGADFRILDAVEDPLPEGDIVLLRQVLQHLSNAQIAKIIPKLWRYKLAIVTEHIPGFDNFTPNIDKEAGPDHRVGFGSGIVLTEPPFNMTAKSSRIVCEGLEFGGNIRTILFESPLPHAGVALNE